MSPLRDADDAERPDPDPDPDAGPGSPAPPVVPGYRLDRLLGRGGSGEVWRAHPRGGGPPVAVKVLLAGDAERQAREAALLGALDHPHLVRLREVVHQPRRGGPPRVALVLDLLEGGSLAALLARRGRLRPGEVVTALAPVAAALARAHEEGVVHGDLSPGNVVFTAEGRPVLTDLGVARVLGEEAAGEVTPAYVDPAVARGGAPGPASDVFGVAAAAFHALTGVAPWNAATPADTLRVAASGELPDLAALAPDAPPALLEVVSRGLSEDPHARGSAAAFALDLRHACRPEPVRLPRAGTPDADLARTGRGPRTELTHQVPGRHRRPAPREVRPAGRGLRWPGRSAVRRLGAGVGTAALVVVAVWGGLAWSRSGPGAAPVAVAGESTVSATPSTSPERAAARPASSPPASTPSSPVPSLPVPSPAPTVEETDWTAVLTALYERRAEAFGTGDAALLAEVYTADSPLLAADRAYLAALGAAGEVLRGFRPTVAQVAVTGVAGADGTVQVQLLDSWPECAVVSAAVPDGPVLRTEAGRAPARVEMVLVPGPDGWRIGSAGRLS
ncbi:serine/threonine-protein kinase [Geodermatophilus sp. SYSU D00766]